MTPAVTIPAMSLTEQAKLTLYEGLITQGFDMALEVIEALQQIRQQRLYRATHKTFEEYLQDRWGCSSSRFRQKEVFSRLVTQLQQVTTATITNEQQARELNKLASLEAKKEVLEKVASAGSVDAKRLREAVREHQKVIAGEEVTPAKLFDLPPGQAAATIAASEKALLADARQRQVAELVETLTRWLTKLQRKAAGLLEFVEHDSTDTFGETLCQQSAALELALRQAESCLAQLR